MSEEYRSREVLSPVFGLICWTLALAAEARTDRFNVGELAKFRTA